MSQDTALLHVYGYPRDGRRYFVGNPRTVEEVTSDFRLDSTSMPTPTPQDRINESFAKIEEIMIRQLEPQARIAGLNAEAAKRSAFSAQLLVDEARRSTKNVHEDVMFISEELKTSALRIAAETRGAAGQVVESINAFTSATNASSARMVFWTRVMALTSFALVLAAVAQIIVILRQQGLSFTC